MYLGITTISVDDYDRAKRFYEEILGFEVRYDVPLPDGSPWIMLAPPGAQTALALIGPRTTGWSADEVGRTTGHTFEVDDVFATHARLQAAGVAFVESPQMMFFGAWARFCDSEGNIFGLHSPVRAELAAV